MRKAAIVLFFILLSNIIYPQDHLIQGVVQTFESVPLIGASVKVKSTKQSVLTDSTGKFVVFCNPKDKLKVTAGGFYTQNVRITPNTKLVAVNLKIKPGEKQQVHAIGYGHVSEEDRTSAVSTVNTTDESLQRYTSLFEMIRDQVPGVQVINGELVIRGTKSFYGSNSALIVVDDVITDDEILNILSPTDVESINVIKDGTSSVYGSRGANGVILIETKKGGKD